MYVNRTAAKTLPCVGGVRASKARQVQEQHLTACLAAGVKISGTGKCTVPGGLSYKLAPTSGVDMGDHLWGEWRQQGGVIVVWCLGISV
jgi:hypothetical protein